MSFIQRCAVLLLLVTCVLAHQTNTEHNRVLKRVQQRMQLGQEEAQGLRRAQVERQELLVQMKWLELLRKAQIRHIVNKQTLSKPKFYRFVQNDLWYLQHMHDWTKGIMVMTKTAEQKQTAEKLLQKLLWNQKKTEDYIKLFKIEPLIKPDESVEAYKNFYLSQKTCQDLTAALWMCLSGYGDIAQAISQYLQNTPGLSSEEKALLQAFVSFNSGSSGSTYDLAKLLNELCGGIESRNKLICAQALGHENWMWTGTRVGSTLDEANAAFQASPAVKAH